MKRTAKETSENIGGVGATKRAAMETSTTTAPTEGDNTINNCGISSHNFVPHPSSPFFCCANCGAIRGFPDAGVIAMWAGSLREIPNGWVLCDGKNGTPDLRDKFIVGSGGEYMQCTTGGSAQVKLNMSYIPAHAHSRNAAGTQEAPVVGRILKAKAGESSNCALELKDAFTTAYSGNKTVYEIPEYHNKTGTAGSSDPTPIDIRPPYYALAFIMRKKQVGFA
jgi:microcystin-dependent protein